MKVSVVFGSPRKKDGYRLLTLIENLMKDISVEYIFLSEKNIKSCLGCDQCFQVGEEKCPRRDDVSIIVEQLKCSDGIIFVSPVYAYQVTGLMKHFIDRTSYLFHRPVMLEKIGMVVATTDGGGGQSVLSYLKMTLSGWGVECTGCLNVVSTRYFSERSQYDKKYYLKKKKAITSITKHFVNKLSYSKESPSYYQLFMFNCLRSKTYTSNFDKKYWSEKGWLDALYYKPVELSFGKKIFSRSMKKIIAILGRKYE